MAKDNFLRESILDVGISVVAFLLYILLTVISMHFLMLKGYSDWSHLGSLVKFIFDLTINLSAVLDTFGFLLVIATGILFATNIFFLRKIMKSNVKPTSKKLFGIGASTSLLFGGCACGISFLSFLGLGSVFLFLPWQGKEVSLIVIGILVFTLYKNIQTFYFPKVCKI